MTSQDQSYRTGESQGQTQEKTGHMMEGVKEKAEQAKQKAGETAQAAKEKLSGVTRGSGERGHETKEHATATGPEGAAKGAFGMGQGDKLREKNA